MRPHPPVPIPDDAALSLGRAVVGVAHDLRQVFQGILDRLADTEDTAPAARLRESVTEAVSIGEAMTADLLAFAGLGPSGPRLWSATRTRRLLTTWCVDEHLALDACPDLAVAELRAIVNLAANARTAAGQDGTVAVRHAVVPEGRMWVVENSMGPGRSQGHGLGLMLVDSFCREAGGRLEIERNTDTCTVRLTLSHDALNRKIFT
ncbi:MAG: hypothetical protein VKO64_08680 [Candidatus Sericytochromatia bacterium]|nr:hypothetical protein [Candidatus Sericytochromatia bacterium]